MAKKEADILSIYKTYKKRFLVGTEILAIKPNIDTGIIITIPCYNDTNLIVTLESLSSEYFRDKNNGGFVLPLYQTLAKKGWVSDYHIVPCANSNNAYHDMYTGNYYQTQQRWKRFGC